MSGDPSSSSSPSQQSAGAPLMYGAGLAWFALVVNLYSVYFSLDPYNFDASGIGLLSVAPFIGGAFGSVFGGIMNDWLILRLSRRNNGVYEPEMRLWLGMASIVLFPCSILLFGLSMVHGMHWIVPCVGLALFGFIGVSFATVVLTYTMDCYTEVGVLSIHRFIVLH